MNEELLQKVLEAVGKTEAEFLAEVEELKTQTEAAQRLEGLAQQQAETSAILLDFIEHLSGGM